jgi:hypothetical protein
MAGERTFVVKFISDVLGATTGIKKVGSDLGTLGKQVDTNLGSKFKSIMPSFKAVAIAGTAAFAAVSAALYKSVEAAVESEAEQNRLRQILKTTTGASDEQIDSLNKQAQALQNLGVVSAGTTSVVQSQLATFDLSIDTIKTLTPAILDYVTAEKGATATADDFKSSTNGLAQALQGNFASLTKTGFVLDDATKKTIKSGTESERAAALVAVLGSTYEGFNASLRDTPEGQLQALQNDFKDLSTAVGIALLPALASAVGFLNVSVVPIFRDFGDSLSKGGLSGGFDFIATRFKESAPKVIDALASMLSQAVQWIGSTGLPMLFAGMNNLAKALTGWIEPRIPMFISSLTKFLMAGYQWIYTKGLPMLLDAVQKLGDTLASFVGKAARQLPAQLVNMIATLGKWILSDGIPAVLEMGAKLGGSLIKWTLTIGGQLIAGLGGAVVALVAAIPDIFVGFVKGIANVAVNTVKGFVGKFDEMKTALANVAVSVVNTLIDVFNSIPLIPNIPKITLDTKKLGTQVGLTGAQLQAVNEKFDAVNGTLKVGTKELNGYTGATNGASNASSGAAKTVKTAKEKLEEYTDALLKSTTAQRSFTKAQKDTVSARTDVATANTNLAKAQSDLSRAIAGYGADSIEAKKAQVILEKAQRDVERAGYGVEESVFAVADAEKALAEVRADPESTPQAIREAEINLAEAKLAVRDAIDSQTEATDELATSQSTLNELINGAIEGSDFYTQFSDALTEAKKRQTDAEDKLADAISAEATAQERLNDANEKAAELAAKYPKIAATVTQPGAIGGDAGIGGGVYGEVAAVAAGLITQDQADELMIRRGIMPFADGGLVKNPMLGLVGEAGPELIIPLSKLGNMGNNINITVNAGLGTSGIEVGREIEQYLREYAGFTGQSYSFGSIGSIF